jgi:hypothetical protein
MDIMILTTEVTGVFVFQTASATSKQAAKQVAVVYSWGGTILTIFNKKPKWASLSSMFPGSCPIKPIESYLPRPPFPSPLLFSSLLPLREEGK